ncbi:MAG: PaaI family thioesterase [Bacteroidota bacterium]|nr:PaaI family thioesterase [Bacteroidota bacterium]
MEKIKNKMAEKGFYHCFGCSPDNPKGLKMEFYKDDDEIVSYFAPSWYYDGWDGIMHGGIIATLMDETGAWTVMHLLGKTGVTTTLTVKYKRPVKTLNGKVEIRGKIEHIRHNIAHIKTELRDNNGNLCSEAEMNYYLRK